MDRMMLEPELQQEARELREELREAWAELRELPLGGRGHLADLQLSAAAFLSKLLEDPGA